MRGRISLLVAATSSAIILALVIPMSLLVRTLAEDRATAAAQQQAQGVAVIVASVANPQAIADALRQVGQQQGSKTSVILPDGQVVGTPVAGSASDPDLRRARDRGAAFTALTPDGAVVLVPIALDAGTAVVRISVSREIMHRGVATAWASLAGLGLALLIGALLIARQLAARIATPVTDLAEVAHRLRSGDVEARVIPAGPEEVREVGTAFNLLAARIGDLLAAERESVADLSHRLRTPMTALRLDSEMVAEPETAERLRLHVDQLQRTVDAVVAEARRPVRATMGGSCDAVAVTAERVRFWGPLAEDQERTITLSVPDQPLDVAIAAVDLRDLLDNLLDNVCAHTPEGTAVAVTVRRADPTGFGPGSGGSSGGADDSVLLTVADEGPGFPDHAQAAERGRSGSGSTGLGLDIVRRIARASGGEAFLGTSDTGGALVTVVLGAAH